jgi:hypothetical protein
MEDCKESTPHQEARVTSEIRQFQAMGAWCTPEFLMRASQSVQHTQRVGREPSELVTTAAGRYLASRTPLVGPDQVKRVLEEMQQLLCDSENELDSANRNELLQVWMSVEGCLSEAEHRRLFPAVLDRLFPGSKAPHDLKKDRKAQMGGY